MKERSGCHTEGECLGRIGCVGGENERGQGVRDRGWREVSGLWERGLGKVQVWGRGCEGIEGRQDLSTRWAVSAREKAGGRDEGWA